MRIPPRIIPVTRRLAVTWTTLGLALVLPACSSARPTPVPPAAPSPRDEAVVPGLPPVPAVTGAPLQVQVRYPGANQLLTSRDSNFVLGTVGSGDVALTINGSKVEVAPNGAFLSWLANPPATAPRYDLVAVRGADTVRRSVAVRFPVRTSLPANGRLRVDSASLSPGRGWWARAGDMQRVSVRAPRNATVRLVGSDGLPRPMLAPPGGMVTVIDSVNDVSAVFATDVATSLLADSVAPARVVITRANGTATDSVQLRVPFVRALPPLSRVLGMLRSASAVGSDTDKVVSARTIVGGTYKWQLLPGTVLEITGRQNGFTRVQLDEQLQVWVDSDEITVLPEGTALPRRVTGGFRLTPSAEYVDVAIGTGERPAHHVEANGRELVLTLYGVQANPEISPIIGNDTLVRRMAWEQVTSDRVRITFTLSQPTYGWLSLWDDVRKSFVLRVRRIPNIDARMPLAGLTIAVDPGHPPAGATGPSGLYEGDAVFPVGQLLVSLLEQRGAKPVITRTSLAPVGLTERGVQTRRANAHAFVSVHLNALPDGVNPFTANGTSTLFYHNASEPLARDLQRALQARFGLRDLGVHYQNLAVARPSWYPSVLAEGLFLMIPEQEAAMRDPAFQRKYAEGLVAGLEAYFRWLRDGGR